MQSAGEFKIALFFTGQKAEYFLPFVFNAPDAFSIL